MKYNLNIQKLVQQFLILLLAIGVGWFVIPFYFEFKQLALVLFIFRIKDANMIAPLFLEVIFFGSSLGLILMKLSELIFSKDSPLNKDI